MTTKAPDSRVVTRVFGSYEYTFVPEAECGRVALSRRLLAAAAVGAVEPVGCVEDFEDITASVELFESAVGHPVAFLLQAQAIARQAWDAVVAEAAGVGVRR